jgi:hypothetical protein
MFIGSKRQFYSIILWSNTVHALRYYYFMVLLIISNADTKDKRQYDEWTI